MGRIRTIKPEFPHSESMGAISREARLLFVMLWTVVDDEGRTRGASRMLASLLYPYDDDAPRLIGSWLIELEKIGTVRRYEVSGSTYLEILNWSKHQKIDHPSTSRIPAYSPEFASPREASLILAPDLGPRTLDLGPRTKHMGGRKTTRPVDCEDFSNFWKAYPRRDGANPKAPAAKKFVAIVKSGTEPQEITAAASRYAAEMRAKGQERTPYVAQAITWLNQQRWGDYSELAADENAAKAKGLVRVMPDTAQWEAWHSVRGKPLPRDRDGGWWCPSEWPANHKELSNTGDQQ